MKITSKGLSQIGLIIGFIGVVILFFWGLPQPWLYEFDVLSGENKNGNELRYLHQILSSVGLGFIGIGFGLQFWATRISK